MPLCSVILRFCLACSSSFPARLVPPRQTLYPPLASRSSTDTQVANIADTHTRRHAQAHIHIRSERATHLLIPFSLIPRHSPQIFPSADLIVRERVCVCTGGGAGGTSATGPSADARVQFGRTFPIFSICTPTPELGRTQPQTSAVQPRGMCCQARLLWTFRPRSWTKGRKLQTC